MNASTEAAEAVQRSQERLARSRALEPQVEALTGRLEDALGRVEFSGTGGFVLASRKPKDAGHVTTSVAAWILLLLVLLLTVGTGGASSARGVSAEPVLIAHRGGDGGTQDTLAAFTSTPATTWEGDIRWTSTGWPVLLHDADLGVFGCPTVLIVNVSMPKARQCGPLASVAQVVSAAKTRGVDLWLELKVAPTSAQWTELDTELAPVKARVVIQSFYPGRLANADRRGYTTAWLSKTATTDLPAGTDWYAPAWATLTEDQVMAMHERGVKVCPWTPEPSDWPSLPTDVDAIITDHPSGSSS